MELGGTYTQSTPTPSLTSFSRIHVPQPFGTVRVYAMPGGEVGIIVDGSTHNTELTINALPRPIPKGYAHSYAYGIAGETHILNIGQITVNSGSIGAIDGFQTANLVRTARRRRHDDRQPNRFQLPLGPAHRSPPAAA